MPLSSALSQTGIKHSLLHESQGELVFHIVYLPEFVVFPFIPCAHTQGESHFGKIKLEPTGAAPLRQFHESFLILSSTLSISDL
jgi:hypothetical protein